MWSQHWEKESHTYNPNLKLITQIKQYKSTLALENVARPVCKWLVHRDTKLILISLRVFTIVYNSENFGRFPFYSLRMCRCVCVSVFRCSCCCCREICCRWLWRIYFDGIYVHMVCIVWLLIKKTTATATSVLCTMYAVYSIRWRARQATTM